MDGYLLDTCVLPHWYDERRETHLRVIARIAALPAGAPLAISAITLGEIEYGHRTASPAGPTPVQDAYRRFVDDQVPWVLEVTHHTANYYGQIRARLFERFLPERRRNGLRPCQLRDPLTSRELGIQENDVWIAAQAAEHRLVLVTADAMQRIRSVVADLLRVEDWTQP